MTVGLDPLDKIPLFLFYLIIFFTGAGTIQLGFSFGNLYRRKFDVPTKANTGTIVASTIAMLTFLLVFQVGIATQRHDTRWRLVLKEANAIGTTWLRAGFLPTDEQTEVRFMLRDYTQSRLDAVDSVKRNAAGQHGQELLAELWKKTQTVSDGNEQSLPFSLFVSSLNDVIDISAERTTGAVMRLSFASWIWIFAMSAITMFLIGYYDGLSGDRQLVAVSVFIAVFAAVIALLIDLDRALEGVFVVSQKPLIDLMQLMTNF